MKTKVIFSYALSTFFMLGLQAQNCPPGENFEVLSGNNVNAITESGASMFFDLQQNAVYEVPAGSGKHAIYAAAPWMGGIDALGQLKVAASTYRQSGTDYFPGPISNDGDAVCGFDQVFKISKAEIDAFIAAGFTNPSENILNWPGKNNALLLAQGMAMNNDLAPFYDANKDGTYDPATGDYPLIKGDNALWRVFNDLGNIHTETGGEPIGMQINALGYSYNTNNYLNNTTFWDFDLLYKATETLNDFYFGFWVDPDLGYYVDDYVGCDPATNTAYVYNGDSNDESSAGYGYGTQIPALAVSFVNGLKNEQEQDLRMSSFRYYNNDNSVISNPETAQHYYNYLKGLWKDGTPMTAGGIGYGGTEVANFMFPDSPNDPNGWSECALDNAPADRRFLMVTGPVTLQPNERQHISLGIVWGDPSNFTYPCPDMKLWIDSYHSDMLAFIADADEAIRVANITSSNVQNLASLQVKILPNPTSDFIVLEALQATQLQSAAIYNATGKCLKTWQLSAQDAQTLHLGEMTNGVYFLKIFDKDNVQINSQKIVVMK